MTDQIGNKNKTTPTEPREAEQVGYGKPPSAHQFKPGISGNPRGRPRKRSHQDGAVDANLYDLILEEAQRNIPFVEGGRKKQMTTIQLILRQLNSAAMKGNLQAQRLATRLFDKAGRDKTEALTKVFRDFKTFQENALSHVEHYKMTGRDPESVLPHPEDVQYDFKTLRPAFNGPMDEAQAEVWKAMQKRKEDLQVDIMMLRELKPRLKKDRILIDTLTEKWESDARLVDRRYPDRETRRRPGFNLPERLKDLTEQERYLKELPRYEAAEAQCDDLLDRMNRQREKQRKKALNDRMKAQSAKKASNGRPHRSPAF